MTQTNYKRNDEPPEDAPPLSVRQVAVAVCWDCEEIIGPKDATGVGEDLWENHDGHNTQDLAEWTEVDVPNADRFFGEMSPKTLSEAIESIQN
jgi:hypothetical protein